MSEKQNHLCKIKDRIQDDFDKYRQLVKDARFVCLKCGRAAREEQRLCKPASLEK